MLWPVSAGNLLWALEVPGQGKLICTELLPDPGNGVEVLSEPARKTGGGRNVGKLNCPTSEVETSWAQIHTDPTREAPGWVRPTQGRCPALLSPK